MTLRSVILLVLTLLLPGVAQSATLKFSIWENPILFHIPEDDWNQPFPYWRSDEELIIQVIVAQFGSMPIDRNGASFSLKGDQITVSYACRALEQPGPAITPGGVAPVLLEFTLSHLPQGVYKISVKRKC